MTVGRILATKGRGISSVEPETILREVVDVLAAKHVGALLVTDRDGAMVGIVSERDVVRAIAKQGIEVMQAPVSRYMTRDVVTATEDESVIRVVQKMSSGRFRHMPVIASGRLVGIVSIGDAIKYRLEQMETEQSAMREYIATA
jgi:CBS domain-containing protein